MRDGEGSTSGWSGVEAGARNTASQWDSPTWIPRNVAERGCVCLHVETSEDDLAGGRHLV